MRTLILGLGNRLMQDDGFGPRLVDYLQERGGAPSGTVLLDGGTLGLDLLPWLEAANRLVVADVLELGNAAGAIVRLAGDAVPRAFAAKLSIHQAGLKDLLAVAELQGSLPAEVVVWGVQPASLELGLELSPAVAAALPRVAERIAAELGWRQSAAGAV